MPKRKTVKDAEGSSAEEEDFESKTAQQANQDDEDDDDEQEEKPKPKKKKKSSGSEKKEGQAKGVKEKIELGKMKFVDVREFKGMTLIDIREYYEDKNTGELKPGKKGISLQADQWETLKENMEAICDKVERAQS